MQDKSQYISELKFCLNLREEEWGCTFGWFTKCSHCATPYLLHKFISWKALHWDMQRLSLQDWKQIVEKY